MSAHTDIQEGIAEAFNVLNEEFFPDDQTVTLLRQSTTTRAFEDVEVIAANWFLEYPTDFRSTFLLRVAENDTLTEFFEVATHVKIGEDVYVIRTGDTLPPKGTSVMWQIYCERFANRDQISPLY